MPIRKTTTCIYDPQLCMFKVTKSKGKSICSGGYGVPYTTPTSTSLSHPSTHTSESNDIGASTSSSAADLPIEDGDGGDKNKAAAEPEPEPEGSKQNTKTTEYHSTSTYDYLFIEEALYLHERGMIDVFHHQHQHQQDEGVDDNTCTGADNGLLMSTRELYELMLNQLNVPLGIYLTYSHLRSQSYIVLRHTNRRWEIIRAMENRDSDSDKGKKLELFCENEVDKSKPQSTPQDAEFDVLVQGDKIGMIHKSTDMNANITANLHTRTQRNINMKRKRNNPNCSELKRLKKELRFDTFHAPVPSLLRQNSSNAEDIDISGINVYGKVGAGAGADDGKARDRDRTQARMHIAFDVYNPNTNFRKTMPGMPDLSVVVTPFGEPSPTWSLLKSILQSCELEACESHSHTPLKIATVSDLGIVSMFGLSDYGVPVIPRI